MYAIRSYYAHNDDQRPGRSGLGRLRAEALKLLQEAPQKEILARVATQAADPLLLPSMAVSAALEAGFFSRVVWVLPSKKAIDELQLKTFHRITSYNVCYTKLLRAIYNLVTFDDD